MINFNKPNCKEVKILTAYIRRSLNRFSKDYTFVNQEWVDDGLNGRLPGAKKEYVVNGLIGNFSQTFRRTYTDGGSSNYNQGQSLYFICMWDEDIPFHIGDKFTSNNLTYIITEFVNIADLDLYYYVTLNFFDVDQERHNNGD